MVNLDSRQQLQGVVVGPDQVALGGAGRARRAGRLAMTPMPLPRPSPLAARARSRSAAAPIPSSASRRSAQAPALSPIENPVAEPGYQPVTLPMPAVEPEIYPANSLWRQGARSFFKDQRARTVGDVVTVQVTIADEATLRNETRRTRDNSDDLSAERLLRLREQARRRSSPTRSTRTTWSI